MDMKSCKKQTNSLRGELPDSQNKLHHMKGLMSDKDDLVEPSSLKTKNRPISQYQKKTTKPLLEGPKISNNGSQIMKEY